MCQYTPYLHYCGCVRILRPSPNPCPLVLRNSMPCPYIAPPESRPNSMKSAPALSITDSTITSSSISTSLIYKYQQSTGYKQDGVVKHWSICPFHAEDREEEELTKQGLDNCWAGGKAVRKARAQRAKRKQREEWEKEWKEMEAREARAMQGEKRKREDEGPIVGLWSLKDDSWASWYHAA